MKCLTSKYLCLILRHKPESIGLILDKHGWANIADLIYCFIKIDDSTPEFRAETNRFVNKLKDIVETDDKQRFSFNEAKTHIRANHGHTVKVDLQLSEMIPPEILYHGTRSKNGESILKEGISKMDRNFVHLSADVETAINVANRRKGDGVTVYAVHALEMFNAEYELYQSKSGVWLTEHVAPRFISIAAVE